MNEGAGIARRRFLGSAVAAAPMLGSAGWLGTCGPASRAARAICRLDELPVGGFRLFEHPGPDDPCILIRRAPHRLVAYSRVCTHESCAVAYRHGADRLECPCHAGAYAVDDGRVLSGPPPGPLKRLAITVSGGEVLVSGGAR
jgi:nitrite reductase/ring-hydroxylating ferredoxin subunit